MGNSLKPFERYGQQERRRIVSDMYLRGKLQREIAAFLGCSVANVSYDLKFIRDMWKEEMLNTYDEKIAEELARIDRIEREADAAWEKSKLDAEVRHTKTTHTLPKLSARDKDELRKAAGIKRKKSLNDIGQLRPSKIIDDFKRTGQTGNPAFLDRICWCIEMRLRIMGAFKDEEKQTGTQINFNLWQGLFTPPDDEAPDPIEQRIADLRAKIPAPHMNGSNGTTDNRNGVG